MPHCNASVLILLMSVWWTNKCKICDRRVQSFSVKHHLTCINIKRDETIFDMWYCPCCVKDTFAYNHIDGDDFHSGILEGISDYGKIKIGKGCWMKLTHKLLIVNFMKLYPAISVPVSLTLKLPKNITEINRGCQLHSRNQSNEKKSDTCLK